jgi:hypothetical protein
VHRKPLNSYVFADFKLFCMTSMYSIVSMATNIALQFCGAFMCIIKFEIHMSILISSCFKHTSVQHYINGYQHRVANLRGLLCNLKPVNLYINADSHC